MGQDRSAGRSQFKPISLESPRSTRPIEAAERRQNGPERESVQNGDDLALQLIGEIGIWRPCLCECDGCRVPISADHVDVVGRGMDSCEVEQGGQGNTGPVCHILEIALANNGRPLTDPRHPTEVVKAQAKGIVHIPRDPEPVTFEFNALRLARHMQPGCRINLSVPRYQWL